MAIADDEIILLICMHRAMHLNQNVHIAHAQQSNRVCTFVPPPKHAHVVMPALHLFVIQTCTKQDYAPRECFMKQLHAFFVIAPGTEPEIFAMMLHSHTEC